jgi:hypothetical protein
VKSCGKVCGFSKKEDLKQLRLAELRKEIATGSAEADRGQFVDGEETFA